MNQASSKEQPQHLLMLMLLTVRYIVTALWCMYHVSLAGTPRLAESGLVTCLTFLPVLHTILIPH